MASQHEPTVNNIEDILSLVPHADKISVDKSTQQYNTVERNELPAPSSPTAQDALEKYGYLRKMSTLTYLFTTVFARQAREARGHPEPYNLEIDEEAILNAADMSEGIQKTLSGPLAAYFNLRSQKAIDQSRTLVRSDLTEHFFSSYFEGGEVIPTPLLQSLDKVFAPFIKIASKHTADEQQNEPTMKGHATFNRVIQEEVVEGSLSFTPVVGVAFGKIATASWTKPSKHGWWGRKTEQESKNDTFEVALSLTLATYELQVDYYMEHRQTVDEIIRKFGETDD